MGKARVTELRNLPELPLASEESYNQTPGYPAKMKLGRKKINAKKRKGGGFYA
jgi:hypothetical protein